MSISIQAPILLACGVLAGGCDCVALFGATCDQNSSGAPDSSVISKNDAEAAEMIFDSSISDAPYATSDASVVFPDSAILDPPDAQSTTSPDPAPYKGVGFMMAQMICDPETFDDYVADQIGYFDETFAECVQANIAAVQQAILTIVCVPTLSCPEREAAETRIELLETLNSVCVDGDSIRQTGHGSSLIYAKMTDDTGSYAVLCESFRNAQATFYCEGGN